MLCQNEATLLYMFNLGCIEINPWHSKIDCFCKTSGSRGLHIYISFAGAYAYKEGRDFIKLLCYFVQDKLPKLTSMEPAVKVRKGKIHLNYLQNRRGQTIAAPYSTRSRKGATVSTPIEWGELKSGLKIADFSVFNVPKQLSEKGDLLSNLLSKNIDMEKASQNLNIE